MLMEYLFKTLCNPDIFRTLVHSQLWYILKSKDIQGPAEYLRWSMLLRTLCNYSKIRRPVYSKLSNFRTTKLLLLLYPVLFIKSMTYCSAIDFFSCSLVYELEGFLVYELQRTPSQISDRILDMVCELNGRKNICIFGNVIMVTKVKEKVQFQKLMLLTPTLTSFYYIMNPDTLGTQTYSE